jgi:hypothetical protein
MCSEMVSPVLASMSLKERFATLDMSPPCFRLDRNLESGKGRGRSIDHDIDVAEVDVWGSAFTLDIAIARLDRGGVEVVRSSPLYSRMG